MTQPAPAPGHHDDVPEQVRVRRDKYDRLVAAETPPYLLGYPRTHSLAEVRDRHADLAADSASGQTVSVTGRVVLSRQGGKLCFATLQEGESALQVMVSLDGVGADRLAAWKSDVDLGDHVGVTGEVISSRRGELSVLATSWALTAKALRPLPDKHKGLTDPEARVRQRYVDLVVNPSSRQMVRDRAAVVRAVRDVLHADGFIEVETPSLQVVHGGAAARPFHTHVNALDLGVTLRIALELYLKRLVVGGLDRVFEIGKNFRNEGIDSTHFPEFTMLEFYEAYGDYDTVADRTRSLVIEAAQRTGRTVVPDGQAARSTSPRPGGPRRSTGSSPRRSARRWTPAPRWSGSWRWPTGTRSPCSPGGTRGRSCSSSTRSSSSTPCWSRPSSGTTRSPRDRSPAGTATTPAWPRRGTSSSPVQSWRPATPSWSTRSSSAAG